MFKTTTLVLLGAVSLVSLTVAQADPFADLEALLGTDTANNAVAQDTETHNAANTILDNSNMTKWSYAGTEKTMVSDITATTVTIDTTVSLYDKQPVESYRVYYAEKSLPTITDTASIQQIIVSPKKTVDNMVSLEIGSLKENTMYYFAVAPVDPTNINADTIAMISEEVNATTRAVPTNAATDTAATDTTAPANTSGATPAIENVSYTQANNSINLTWKAVNGYNMDIQIRHQADTSYKNVGNINANNGSTNFQIDKTGNYFLKMSLRDKSGATIGREHVQTVKVETIENPTAPVVQNPPKVGPTSNMLVLL